MARLLDDFLGRLAGARDVAQHALDQVKVHAARHAHPQVQQRPAPPTPARLHVLGAHEKADCGLAKDAALHSRACQQDLHGVNNAAAWRRLAPQENASWSLTSATELAKEVGGT